MRLRYYDGHLGRFGGLSMTYLCAIPLLVSFLITPFQSQTGGPKVEYDKVKDTTRVTQSVESINVKGARAIKFIAYYGFDGKAPSTVSGHGIVIAVVRDAPQIGSVQEMRLIIDGKPEGPYTGTLVDSGRYPEGFTQFYLFEEITMDIFERIANAGKVDARIGSVEFELSARAVKQINAFYRGMPKPVNLKVEYDKDEDATSVSTGVMEAVNVKGAENVYLHALYDYPGKIQRSKVEESFLVGFSYAGQGLELDLDLSVDGRRHGPYRIIGEANEQISTGGTKVYVVRGSAHEIIELIANGHTVSGEIGNIKFEIPPEAINRIKELYNRMHKGRRP